MPDHRFDYQGKVTTKRARLVVDLDSQTQDNSPLLLFHVSRLFRVTNFLHLKRFLGRSFVIVSLARRINPGFCHPPNLLEWGLFSAVFSPAQFLECGFHSKGFFLRYLFERCWELMPGLVREADVGRVHVKLG